MKWRLLFLTLTLAPLLAHARWHRGWYGALGSYERWHYGYWYHGPYLDHIGWWWVVGPTWYYYPDPIYPYPPLDPEPEYYVMVDGTPPAPAVPPGDAPKSPSKDDSKAYTFLCEASQIYYPYTTMCKGEWKTMAVPPPPKVRSER